jgi:hypothetical protein
MRSTHMLAENVRREVPTKHSWLRLLDTALFFIQY